MSIDVYVQISYDLLPGVCTYTSDDELLPSSHFFFPSFLCFFSRTVFSRV
ncbi:hypothetical protein CSUI_008920 [Cystoisospora suis]|uniref:Uncharacterized protein n=1 Tax=Cystoisospora suis TaxID=483139 RepID=A0A2C6KJG9_9APIC|nr:hypothetical protein CSUI_008920 [Cystoisospora suis]